MRLGENGDRVSVQFGHDDLSSRDGESLCLPEAHSSGQSESVAVSLSPLVIRRERNGSVSAECAGTLRKIAGHGTLTTTRRYLHPDRQSVTNAGDLLSRHLWSPNGPQLRVI
jgi:hypothetical protein